MKIILTALVIFFFSLGSASAWSTHVFRAEPAPDGAWRVLSMPKEIMESDEFHSDTFNRSVIWVCRDKNVWDSPIVSIKTIYSPDEINEFMGRYNNFTKTLDQILPNEEIISIVFWIDYSEFLMLFHPDKWQDKKFHENVAKMINKHRKNFYDNQ